MKTGVGHGRRPARQDQKHDSRQEFRRIVMKVFRSLRLVLLASALCVVPASSFAGVFISVNIAPPVLPVYEQPPCPEDGYLWTPGYWAYGPDGYYWIPGAWVPAPQPGYLWTPPYWGFDNGVYLFHAGYWGSHIGYYGGVNYGFGYMGWGFAGGEWRGGHFFYNTAIMHVGGGFHNVYRNETIVHNTTIINNYHTSYNGGPNGIHYQPRPEERAAMNERHIAPTSIQQQHFQAAERNPEQRFSANHGRPQVVAAARPMSTMHPETGNRPNETRPMNQARPMNQPQNRPTPQSRPETQYRPQAQQQSRPQTQARPEQQYHPQTQARPEARPQPQSRPESHPAPHPQEHEHPHGR
jgi:hypothetical protein